MVEAAALGPSESDDRIVCAAVPARPDEPVELDVLDLRLPRLQRAAECNLAEEHAAVPLTLPDALRADAVVVRLGARLRKVEPAAVPEVAQVGKERSSARVLELEARLADGADAARGVLARPLVLVDAKGAFHAGRVEAPLLGHRLAGLRERALVRLEATLLSQATRSTVGGGPALASHEAANWCLICSYLGCSRVSVASS